MPPPTKKRKLQPSAVEEVIFDLASRQEYLTGFHKRKLQRAKQAQEAAEKRAKVDKIEERRKLREERKAELERHVQEVNALLRPTNDSGESDDDLVDSSEAEWNGVDDITPPPVDHKAEYVDEEKYTTVTVEAIDISKEGLHKVIEQDQDESGDLENVTKTPAGGTVSSRGQKVAKREWTKEKPKDRPDKPKKKRKKFRYEGKAERKFTRMKEKSKNSKQAKARRDG